MDYKFSIIVPAFREPYETVKRNFDSILDQDYKNWEIIFVPNGQWTGKKSLINKVKRDYKMVKILDLEEANVCKARNKGAEIASGDIYSFLSADLALHSGTLRTWQLEFTKHPECAVVYSGYSFFPNTERDVFLSEDFDQYKLGCYNYIDGANPVKREANAEFDPEIISLNDWDWILSITDKGHKGYYIPEPLFSADQPKRGGLSHDSATNWLKRVDQIKAKHNIPTRETVCTSLLDPNEALRIAKLIGADYHAFPSQKPNHYKVVYCYGFGCTDELLGYQTALLTGEVIHAHKIIHWIGLDVRMLVRRAWAEVEALTKGIFTRIKEHWTIGRREHQILGEIFKTNDIKLKNVYPPIESPRKGDLMEKVYINDPELYLQIQLAMPDVWISNKNDDGIPRISVHFQDKAANVIHSAAEGSYVISEHLLPYTGELICDNVPNMRRQIVHTIRKLNNDGVEKDKEAMKYYQGQSYFKQKIRKYEQTQIRSKGRLMDIMDGFSEQKLKA